MRNFLIVLFSTLIVFAYASADNAISPLVSIFQFFFQVPQATVLYLISSCTLGIVVGTFIGPTLVARYTAQKILLYSVITLSVSTLLFMSVPVFGAAVIFRFIFGVCCGFLNCIIWWITFHEVSGKTTDAMIIVTTASRPVAMCLGLPLVGLMTSLISWQVSYLLLIFILLLSAMVLFFYFNDAKTKETTKPAVKKLSFMKEYKAIFSLPHSVKFYFGLLMNSFCYFGFYAFSGIWFAEHYSLNFLQVSTLFLLLGGAEVAASFFASWIFRYFPYRKAFLVSALLAFIFFPLFIYGYFPLHVAVGFIMLFILFNRAIIFAMIRTLPAMFPAQGNKTSLGALITISIWFGFATISAVQAKLLASVGIHTVETILFLSLLLGTTLIYIAEKKTVFVTIDRIN